jgi:hypothetical protein
MALVRITNEINKVRLAHRSAYMVFAQQQQTFRTTAFFIGIS